MVSIGVVGGRGGVDFQVQVRSPAYLHWICIVMVSIRTMFHDIHRLLLQ